MRRLAMKKIYLTLVLVLSMSCNMFAQSDGFFKSNDEMYNRINDPNAVGLNLPQTNIGEPINAPATPLGSGLLILTAVGLGYAIRKRKK